MTWYTLNCGDPMLCDPIVAGVVEAFQLARRSGQISADAAIYSRHESRGSLHCELILYFTPDTSLVARQMGARACGKPSMRGLAPLAGVPAE